MTQKFAGRVGAGKQKQGQFLSGSVTIDLGEVQSEENSLDLKVGANKSSDFLENS